MLTGCILKAHKITFSAQINEGNKYYLLVGQMQYRNIKMKENIGSYKLKKSVLKKFWMKAVLLGLVIVFPMTACNDTGGEGKQSKKARSENSAVNSEGVVLRISDAALIQVDSNPEYNTAEWHFTVNKAGRYDVWLSSLTRDTTFLNFADSVIITAGDTRLTGRPVGDEIVTDDISVKKPWYRADSHMGSIFFREPGEYQVQVISDRVREFTSDLSDLSVDKETLINSLILKPTVR